MNWQADYVGFVLAAYGLAGGVIVMLAAVYAVRAHDLRQRLRELREQLEPSSRAGRGETDGTLHP